MVVANAEKDYKESLSGSVADLVPAIIELGGTLLGAKGGGAGPTEVAAQAFICPACKNKMFVSPTATLVVCSSCHKEYGRKKVE